VTLNVVFAFVVVSCQFNLLRFAVLQYPGNVEGGIKIIYNYAKLIARKTNINTIKDSAQSSKNTHNSPITKINLLIISGETISVERIDTHRTTLQTKCKVKNNRNA
jgi:hypothetical protein